jgi:hypothetical protein
MGSRRRAHLAVAEFRDPATGRRRELCRAGGAQPGIDRESGGAGFRVPHGPGHGFDGDSGVQRARTERLQRAFRINLLSPAAAVQPGRRLSSGKAAARQRAHRRGLGRTPAARGRAATVAEQGSGVSRRRRLRQAGDLRGAGKPGREVSHPYSGQREPGAGCG